MSRLTDLHREFETAWRNAKAANTMGRYDIASWWESRAIDLAKEIKRLEQEGNDGLSKPI